MEHGKGGGGGGGGQGVKVKAEVVFTMRNPVFRVFLFWLEFATKFTMLSCDLGVEARCGRRNGFPRRSPKFAREECTLAATPYLRIKNRKNGFSLMGSIMKPSQKTKKPWIFYCIFDPKNRGK